MADKHKHQSKHERAYALIRQRILDGVYGPGQRLVIDALAAELGISAVPVREAIRRLEAEGRVVYRHNAGARVAPTAERRQLRIGIDAGGTNVDAVLMEGMRVVAAVKRIATDDIAADVAAVIEALLRDVRATPSAVTAVMIGTTHFARAFMDRRIDPCACLRLGLPATAALPPMADWPGELREAIGGKIYLAHGGHDFDGSPLAAVDCDELSAIAADMRAHDIRSVAISAVFSPITSAAEEQAAAVLRTHLPEAALTLSHQIGRMGLLERENAAIINACLVSLARAMIARLRDALRRLGLATPLYLTQNDGTLMTASYAERFPVLTFSSGKTNSIRGAGFLAGVRDAVVVDIGSASTDVGVLAHGFPRESALPTRIGGVRTNVRMPDVLSVPLGGGSHIASDPWRVEHHSVGARLGAEALVFGGNVMTATDAGVAAGALNVGESAQVAHLRERAQAILDTFGATVRDLVERMRLPSLRLPVVLVGGGGPLLQAALLDVDVIVPEHYAVANAVGAAIAPVSGEIDRVVVLEGLSRQEAIAAAVADAVAQAVAAGADPTTVQVVSADDMPLAYLPASVTRLRVKAIGDLGRQ